MCLEQVVQSLRVHDLAMATYRWCVNILSIINGTLHSIINGTLHIIIPVHNVVLIYSVLDPTLTPYAHSKNVVLTNHKLPHEKYMTRLYQKFVWRAA
jgi:hypothetical protein